MYIGFTQTVGKVFQQMSVGQLSLCEQLLLLPPSARAAFE